MICSFEECTREVWSKGLCAAHYAQRRNGRPLTPIEKREPNRPCDFPGCRNDTSKGSGGLCGAHRIQFREGVELHPLRDFGEMERWLDAHSGHVGEDCLIWPFARNKRDGRGLLKFRGKSMSSARAMCMLAHGDPPTPRHEAAHSCGHGHEGCVSPVHLRWATKKENADDRVLHGTSPVGEKHPRAILTDDKVREIRRLAASHKRREIADMFGISYETVIDVVNYRSWRHV